MSMTAQAVKTVLHVGCGPPHRENLHARFRTSDWREVRVDLDPFVQPDVVASITDLSLVADESVDAVWSSHTLEHLFAHEVPAALGEMHRVLRPGGFAFLTLPDLKQVAARILADQLEEVIYVSPAGPIMPLDCVFGHGAAIAAGRTLMAHRTGFTAKTLRKHLVEAGFDQVAIDVTPLTLWA